MLRCNRLWKSLLLDKVEKLDQIEKLTLVEAVNPAVIHPEGTGQTGLPQPST